MSKLHSTSLMCVVMAAFVFVVPELARTNLLRAQPNLPYTFAEPTPLPEPLNYPGFWNSSANTSADGLELYLTSNRSPGWGTYVATRSDVSDPFGTPSQLDPDLNHGVLSQDGLSLYGNSDTLPGSGLNDVFVMTRPQPSGPFGPPQNLGAGVNSSQSDRWPSISSDGLELYFTRTISDDIGGAEIYVAKRDDPAGPFSTAVRLPSSINTGTTVSAPAISSDGLTLFFSASRPGGYGNYDIWASTRPSRDAEWGEAINLGPEVNGQQFEWKPSLSSDQTTLYFTRFLSFSSSELWSVSIPEPSTIVLFSIALFCLSTRARRKPDGFGP